MVDNYTEGKFLKCGECRGKGRRLKRFLFLWRWMVPRFVKCKACDGTGEIEMSASEIADEVFFDKVDAAKP